MTKRVIILPSYAKNLAGAIRILIASKIAQKIMYNFKNLALEFEVQ